MPAIRHLPGQHFLRGLTLLTALLLLATGCWPLPPENSIPGSTSPLPTGTGVAPTSEAAGQVAPDVLNIEGEAQDPPTLDPALASDPYSQFVVRQLFSGLVTFDENLKVVPDMAADLPQVSSDGKTYTFALRKGVRFTNGEEVKASDFKYSIERAADPRLAGPMPPAQLPAALYLGDIVGVMDKLQGKANDVAGVTAPDPYTLVITIDSPRSYFLSKLAAGPALVVQQSNVEMGENWTENARGTGPFKLQKWVHNQQIVLSRNTDYYAGPPALAQVNILMGTGATNQLQQFADSSNALDVANLTSDDLAGISDRNDPLSRDLQTVPDLSTTYLGFNVTQKPFDDPKVREALARVIDRQKITRVLYQSRFRPATHFVPSGIGGYTPPNTDNGYNVTRARQLIAESTYKDAANIPTLKLYTAGDPVGPMLRDTFSQTLGINVELHEVEWSDYQAGLGRGDYPMFVLTWAAGYPDPEAVLGSLFRSSSPDNHTGYRNGDVDSALSLAASEPDAGKRMATYAEVEQRVLQDYPAVPLYQGVSYTLVKPYVRGLQVTPMGILSLRNVHLTDRQAGAR